MSDSHRTEFDWHLIKQKVDAAFAHIDCQLNLPHSEIERILKARAKALARPLADTESAEFLEVLEFHLGQERYALESCYVREVHPLDNLTTLPGVPDFVVGVVHIRGEILSVVDIKRFFALPERGITHLNKVIVLEHGSMVFGILADELVGVHSLPISAMDSSRRGPIGIDGGYIRGITITGLAILNGQSLLTDERLIVQ